MTELKRGTWVVVTDSEKALFLRNLTDHQDPNFEVMDTEEQENPSDIEQSANRPGRMQDTGVQQMSALDDTDWHELQKERFASDLSDILYAAAHKGEFDRLILVAAPKVLGHLRDDMHKEVTSKVVSEIPKNLAGHPVDEIEKLVKKELESA
ncbi:Protein required for attachment to host cells [Roseovarius sp. THAF27]|uniref:host attachment family protein n=1 Tax=Roseovarius sp. THAF27 TaxID=2587850 RepID=UPI001268D085|nr:host attachment family protein [Roseovarius sp. THAF27]QFT82156.1 Protein required for attachment to host cells [Roseovarius sp. THAF27]